MTEDYRAICGSQAISLRAPLVIAAYAVATAAVLGAIVLNASHAFTSNAPAGVVQAGALAAIYAAVGLGGAVAGHALIEARGFLRKLVSGVVLIVAVAVCLATALGAQSSGRADNTARRSADADARLALEQRRDAILVEIRGLGNPRAVGVIQTEVQSTKIDMGVWRRSGECSDISREDTRIACEPILALYRERGAAARKAELLPQLDAINGQIAKLPPATGASDPQADNLAWLIGLSGRKVESADVGRGLNIGLAAMIELFAALSAALAAVTADIARRRSPQTAPALPTPATPQPVPPPVPAQPAVVAQCIIQGSPSAADAAILATLRARGGRFDGTQRSLAEVAGVPKTTAHTALRRLESAAQVRIGAGFVELVRPAGLRVVA